MIKICRNFRTLVPVPSWPIIEAAWVPNMEVAKCGQQKAEMKIWVCLKNGIYLSLWLFMTNYP